MKSLLRSVLSLGIVGALTLGGFSAAHAQDARSYEYKSFNAAYTVNQDSTVSVREDLTYTFNGEYHQGYRSITHKGSSGITDIKMTDLTTGQQLVYSSARLDKTNPQSWGKYTTYVDNGATNIEWYYDLQNTNHIWEISYTLTDSISFYKDHDELYWNIFSDLDAPVQVVQAQVTLPGGDTTPTYKWYVNGNNHAQQVTMPSSNSYLFMARDFAAGEPATIALGWQKGLVLESESHHFWDGNWPYIASALVALFTLLFSIAYWYLTERYNVGRGTVIAQYEPPQNLPPAKAELLMKERITNKAWPATVIDLAVRGYLTISEDKPTSFGKVTTYVVRFVAALIVLAALFFFVENIVQVSANASVFASLISDLPFTLVTVFIFLFVGIRIFLLFPGMRSAWSTPKEYTLTATGKDMEGLELYERTFLGALFGADVPVAGALFSTVITKSSPAKQRALYLNLQTVRSELKDGMDSADYVHTFGKQSAGILVIILAVVLAFVVLTCGNIALSAMNLATVPISALVLGASIVLAIGFLAYTVFFETRLSAKGNILREDWLGFKLFLYTAERYRLQNLTPDMFEKYLPYAIIFSIERKWAQAFQSLNLSNPGWYNSSAYGTGAYIGAFSPSSFANSFSGSFANSFANSGGSSGGFSGGGGFAGGGGGGGGGGAS